MKEFKQKRNIIVFGPTINSINQWIESLRRVEDDAVESVSLHRLRVEMKSGAVAHFINIGKHDLPDAFMRLGGLSFDTMYVLPGTHHEVFRWAYTRLRSADKTVTAISRWVGHEYIKEEK